MNISSRLEKRICSLCSAYGCSVEVLLSRALTCLEDTQPPEDTGEYISQRSAGDDYTQAYEHCEWCAVLECRTLTIGKAVFSQFKAERHNSFSLGEHAPIMLCEVEQQDRTVLVFFNGDCISGYGILFQWVESHAGDVALISVGNAMDYPSYDRFQNELMQDCISMMSRGENFVEQERRLVRRFIAAVDLDCYTEQQLRRIVDMCLLGDDPLNKKESVLQHMLTGGSSEWIWSSAILDCNTSVGEPVDGSNYMARVMAHMIYLEELSPSRTSVRKGKGLFKMKL